MITLVGARHVAACQLPQQVIHKPGSTEVVVPAWVTSSAIDCYTGRVPALLRSPDGIHFGAPEPITGTYPMKSAAFVLCTAGQACAGRAFFQTEKGVAACAYAESTRTISACTTRDVGQYFGSGLALTPAGDRLIMGNSDGFMAVDTKTLVATTMPGCSGLERVTAATDTTIFALVYDSREGFVVLRGIQYAGFACIGSAYEPTPPKYPVLIDDTAHGFVSRVVVDPTTGTLYAPCLALQTTGSGYCHYGNAALIGLPGGVGVHCGDSIITTGEICDGAGWTAPCTGAVTATGASKGYISGTMTCASGCVPDESACVCPDTKDKKPEGCVKKCPEDPEPLPAFPAAIKNEETIDAEVAGVGLKVTLAASFNEVGGTVAAPCTDGSEGSFSLQVCQPVKKAGVEYCETAEGKLEGTCAHEKRCDSPPKATCDTASVMSCCRTKGTATFTPQATWEKDLAWGPFDATLTGNLGGAVSIGIGHERGKCSCEEGAWIFENSLSFSGQGSAKLQSVSGVPVDVSGQVALCGRVSGAVTVGCGVTGEPNEVAQLQVKIPAGKVLWVNWKEKAYTWSNPVSLPEGAGCL